MERATLVGGAPMTVARARATPMTRSLTDDVIVTCELRVYVVSARACSRRATPPLGTGPKQNARSPVNGCNIDLDRKRDLVSNTPRLLESRIMSKNEDTLVLVADDEPSMLALLSAYIRSKGYRVLEASDGDMAWQLAREHLPHAVVLDVMMPGMSGWEVCKKIRESVSLAHTGVVMLTGIGESLNELTSPLYGADAYIDKPFEFAELEARIRETLERRRDGGALGRPDGGALDDDDNDSDVTGMQASDADDDSDADEDDEDDEDVESSRTSREDDEPITQRFKKPGARKGKKKGPKRAAAAAKSGEDLPSTDEAARATKKKAGKKVAKKVASKKAASKKVAKKTAKKAASKKVAKKAASKKVAKKTAKKAAGKKAASKKVAKKTAKKAAGKKVAKKVAGKKAKKKGKR